MKELLKDYVAQLVIVEYARAAGLRGRVEQNRYYKFNDPEVRDGAARKGDIREGRHMHVQVIVSAKTQDQQLAISPLSNELAGSIGRIKGNEVYKGFSRNQFKEASEKAWDEKTGYPSEVNRQLCLFPYHEERALCGQEGHAGTGRPGAECCR